MVLGGGGILSIGQRGHWFCYGGGDGHQIRLGFVMAGVLGAGLYIQ